MHIIINAVIAKQIFNEERYIQSVYYPADNVLMLGARSDEVFKSIHKTILRMLKIKNMQYDVAIAIHDIIIDNNLDKVDRILTNEVNETTKIIRVFL